MDVPGVGVLWLRCLQRSAAFGDALEDFQLGWFVVFQVVGIDHGGLVGRIDTGRSDGEANFDGLGEIAGMVGTPGIAGGGIIRKRLAVAAVQAHPVLFEAGAGVGEPLVRVWEFFPGFLGHASLSLVFFDVFSGQSFQQMTCFTLQIGGGKRHHLIDATSDIRFAPRATRVFER